jgi:ribosomal-protein-alanine N-acetyltransferase
MIETTRLRLRPFAAEDLDDLHQLWTDPEVRRYLFDGEIIPRERVEAEIAASISHFETHGFGLWSVFPKDSYELIGFCGYRFFHDPPELQLLYGMSPARWGRGLTTEAARAMIRYGFEELGFTRIIASADAPNAASLRVMEKSGMAFEKQILIGGLNTVCYALAREAFQPDDSLYLLLRGEKSSDL